MAREIDIGIIGGGRGAIVHTEAVRAVRGATAVGIAGRPGHPLPAAEGLALPACDIDTLVRRVDAVVVAVPPSAVAEVLSAVPETMPALVECPPAEATGRAAAMTAVNLLHADTVRRGLDAIGRLDGAHHLLLRGRSPRPDWGGHGTAAFGAGVLLDPHAGSLPVLLAAAGRPVVSTVVRTDLDGDAAPGPVETVARVTFELDDGRRARADLAWETGEPLTDLEVAAGSGVVRIGLWPRPTLELDGAPFAVDATDPLRDLGFVAQMERFVRVAAGRASPWPPVAVGASISALAPAPR